MGKVHLSLVIRLLPSPSNKQIFFTVFYDHPVTELQKVGILLSRIPDIPGGKSGHFHIVVNNLSIFGIKRLKHNLFMTQFNSK